MKIAFVVLICLLFFLLYFLDEVKAADISVIGTTTGDPFGTINYHQRRFFYAQGRFWAFYHNGTYWVWKTSTDGITWSPSSIVNTSATNKNGFAVTTNGTHVHYVETNGSSPSALDY